MIIPEKCSSKNGCEAEARVRVFWPGQGAKLMCPSCASQAQRVLDSMGLPLHVETLVVARQIDSGLLRAAFEASRCGEPEAEGYGRIEWDEDLGVARFALTMRTKGAPVFQEEIIYTRHKKRTEQETSRLAARLAGFLAVVFKAKGEKK